MTASHASASRVGRKATLRNARRNRDCGVCWGKGDGVMIRDKIAGVVPAVPVAVAMWVDVQGVVSSAVVIAAGAATVSAVAEVGADGSRDCGGWCEGRLSGMSTSSSSSASSSASRWSRMRGATAILVVEGVGVGVGGASVSVTNRSSAPLSLSDVPTTPSIASVESVSAGGADAGCGGGSAVIPPAWLPL